MTLILATAASIIALIAGYFAWPVLWLLLIALGYFFHVCLSRYNQTMLLLQQERVGLVTISFAWMYLASLVGVGLTYGVGWAVSWLMQSIA